MAGYLTDKQIIKLQDVLTEARFEEWKHVDLFTWQWFLLIVLAFVPWVVWWKLVDKKRVGEILLYGLLLSLIAGSMDEVGAELAAWWYPIKILPLVSGMLAIHYMTFPIFYMFIYQYFNTWKSFTIACTVLAAVFAFILEPTLVWMGIYKLLKWKYIYSFPVYIMLGVSIRALVKWIYQEQEKAIAGGVIQPAYRQRKK